ncbi:MAG: hypothetical protein IJH88_03660 [Eggerthellaceae bacterium]|nr:hypothetical protein [Eggerthellaceae bacterium]
MSAPKAFWTAVKSPSKVKVSGGKIKWGKVKGAKGYAAGITWIYSRGYNIFGKLLTGEDTKWKNAGKKRWISAKYGKEQGYHFYSCRAIAYTKHGGYYYVDGCTKSKKLKKIFSQLIA